jgi:hypothetical protein
VLPETPPIIERPNDTEPDELHRVEVNRETIQAVVSILSRPEIFSRQVTIESFWEGGQAVFVIDVSVYHDMTSLHIVPPVGEEKRIIVTPDKLYIWYPGDESVFVGNPAPSGDGVRAADEWHMLLTFENILDLNRNDIIDGGYTEFNGELSVFALYRSAELGNTREYFISLDLGLVIAVNVHDERNMLIYSMTAGETAVGVISPDAFILPDGIDLIAHNAQN